jgi:hypothetical protein
MVPVSETLYTARNTRDVQIHRPKPYYIKKKPVKDYYRQSCLELWTDIIFFFNFCFKILLDSATIQYAFQYSTKTQCDA